MKTYRKNDKYAVAINKDGKFFGLRESYSTTSPFTTDHPSNAKKVRPHREDEELQPAPYYFENSHRMRHWLEGYEMVWIEEDTSAIVVANTE